MARNTSVTLGDHFDNFVAKKIAQGRFHSVSETIRAGLRRLEEDELKLEQLKAKLQVGEESPLMADFSATAFIEKMHSKHVK